MVSKSERFTNMRVGTKVRVRVWGGDIREARIIRLELPFLVWLDDGLPGAVHPSRLEVVMEQLTLSL